MKPSSQRSTHTNPAIYCCPRTYNMYPVVVAAQDPDCPACDGRCASRVRIVAVVVDPQEVSDNSNNPASAATVDCPTRLGGRARGMGERAEKTSHARRR